MKITRYDARVLNHAVRHGHLKPEDFPGDENEAFRLLIRSIRARRRPARVQRPD